MKKHLVKLLFKQIKFGNHGYKVLFWDGEEQAYGNPSSNLKIIFTKAPSFKLGANPIVTLGEAYMDGTIEFEGDFEEVIHLAELNKNGLFNSKLLQKLTNLFSSVDKARQKENIHHHYDLGNEFFRLWLDDTMSYSCAYFKTPTDSLLDAQLQKVRHILKKLHLQSGELLLDIGCGWGWLITTAAELYGVRALGITLSEEQYKATKERIEQKRLTDKVSVMLINYLDLDAQKYQFDKIVSVGMFEHVGKENLARYMAKVHQLLVPGGLSLLHTITGAVEDDVNPWIAKYIFPGGYIPSLRETVWLLPEYNFNLLHVESLRMHYAMTLDRWRQNFWQHIQEIEEMYGSHFIRMWDLYLRGCAASFRCSGLNIHQLLFSKGLKNDLPLTYKHLYADDIINN